MKENEVVAIVEKIVAHFFFETIIINNENISTVNLGHM